MAKQKKNKNVIWIFDETYRQEYLVVFAPNYKKFCEVVKKEIKFCPKQEEGDENCTGEFTGLSNKHSSLGVIWSSDKSVNLVHELLHACAWTLRNRDIFLTPDAEETYAYYYAYLYRTVMEKIREGRGK
jgi:hypothetical protein